MSFSMGRQNISKFILSTHLKTHNTLSILSVISQSITEIIEIHSKYIHDMINIENRFLRVGLSYQIKTYIYNLVCTTRFAIIYIRYGRMLRVKYSCCHFCRHHFEAHDRLFFSYCIFVYSFVDFLWILSLYAHLS